MQPTLSDGHLVFFLKTRSFSSGDIVLAKINDVDYVKRLHLNGDSYELYGDNSADSKDFYALNPTQLRAKLIWPSVK
jgi:SOS-response transcriptional repressor LexA